MKLGWYQFKSFDDREYEYYEKLDNGDLNWVIPGKFMAFMGPVDEPEYDRLGNSPEDYIQVFKHFNITRVIRLNEAKYDRKTFVDEGINHSDLFFIDGSVPPEKVVNDFMEISEKEEGGIAIHCKAGLGRTGTLIGLYAMKHFKFPAAAFIGWIRIARPGSILGPQQYYLLDMEEIYLGKDSAAYKNRGAQRKLEMSPIDIRKSQFGEKNQGESLVQRKYATPSRHMSPISADRHMQNMGGFQPPPYGYGYMGPPHAGMGMPPPGYDYRGMPPPHNGPPPQEGDYPKRPDFYPKPPLE